MSIKRSKNKMPIICVSDFFFVDAWSTVTSDFANLLKNADSYLHNIQSNWFGAVAFIKKKSFSTLIFFCFQKHSQGDRNRLVVDVDVVSRRCLWQSMAIFISLWLFLFTVLVCWNFAYKFQTFLDSKKCVLFKSNNLY